MKLDWYRIKKAKTFMNKDCRFYVTLVMQNSNHLLGDLKVLNDV